MNGMWRRQTASALVVLAMSATAACSQNKPAVCTQVDAVQSSTKQLQRTSLSENGIGSLSTALADVRNQLKRLQEEASTQFQPQIAAVRTATDQVQQRVSEAKAAPSAQAFGQVGVALGGLQTAVQDLTQAFKNTC
ncbi:MAG TPA: hypothetical protein VI248_20695 [Kineosporiaceae bacterium]